MDNNAIIVDNVSKSFKLDNRNRLIKKVRKNVRNSKPNLFSIENISFNVKKGEILGIIGTNGSGKTTLLRLMAGVYSPEKGNIQVNGKLAPLLQLGVGFQGDLNAKENIIMNGMLLGMSKLEILKKINNIISYAELENFSNLKLKHYSAGMRSRLSFSTAMQLESDIILIDEIMSVGDKNFRKKSYETFLSFKKNQKTIVHVTHNLEKLEKFSDRVLLLDKGKMIMISKPKEVIDEYNKMLPTKQI